jgi:CheY-like chemotaxis protein
VEEALAAGVLILVAEDNPTNQTVIRMLLDRLGYAAEMADHGREALQRLAERRYGLLITDCHMPEMDGYELTRSVRTAEAAAGGGRRLPIVALTADALIGTAQQCHAAGMDDYLAKPVGRDTLDRTIRRWLPKAAEMRRPKSAPMATAAPSSPPPTGTGGEGEAVLDLTYLREEVAGGAEEMIKPLLDDFLATTRPTLEETLAALAAADWPKARKAAHAAKGAARMAGARRLSRLCEVVEKSIAGGDTAAALACRDHLMPAFAEVEKAVGAL